MSVVCCNLCEKLIDTDFELEVDGYGNCICNECADQFKPALISS